MQHILGRILGLVVLGAVAMVAGPAQAVTSTGPYYTTPSWDQKLPGATRFVVLTDWNREAVLDRETGLVWEKSPAASTVNWIDARYECLARTTGGRQAWRLPSVHELASLLDPNNPGGNPDLPPGHPFTNVQSASYWSATTTAEHLNNAWLVVFVSGNMLGNLKSGITHAWCVRGGGPLSEY